MISFKEKMTQIISYGVYFLPLPKGFIKLNFCMASKVNPIIDGFGGFFEDLISSML